MAQFADIIIDSSAQAVDRPFTYRIPEALSDRIRPGVRVRVPFGNAKNGKAGYVIRLMDSTDFLPDRIKEITEVLPRAVNVEDDMIELALFLSQEYGSTLNQALKTVLPVKQLVRKNARRTDPVLRITSFSGEKEHGGRHRLNEEQQRVVSDVTASMRRLYGCGKENTSGDREKNRETERGEDREKGREQEKPVLLYGVTGSGKTLVYIRLIEEALSSGREAIVLIPEISLTYQTVRALSDYFGERVAVLHSRLSAGERYEQYEKARQGAVSIMVGPRSAIFAPFNRLGLIIIDEEHERAYHSDTAPRYDVREVARLRASLAGAVLLMGSATPSLKSYSRALSGEYMLYCLTHRAVPGASKPHISVVDLRMELAKGNYSIFSEKLAALIEDRLLHGEQIMLFINRRGYAGFVSCRSCGHVMKCPHCDVSLTAHNSWFYDKKSSKREGALLSCHYCGYETALSKLCPSCKSPYIAPFGTGTQKLEQAVRRAFPAARVIRMDADSTAKKFAHEKLLSSFQKGEADILIGTQMIVKGHDFPRVTLVGIVAADLSLNTSEYDASEQTFELLTQAAGRAGRAERPGDVVIQSYDPSHYAIACAAAQDYEAFYAREMSYRKLLRYPPCTEMLSVLLQSEDEKLLDRAANSLGSFCESLAKKEDAELIGPCRAAVYKLNDYYRKILYIKHGNHAIINQIRENIKAYAAVQQYGRALYISFDLM